MQGKKPFWDKRLGSFRLSERVPPDDFYRRLKQVLDLRWIYVATKKYYGTEGQNPWIQWYFSNSYSLVV